MQTQMLLPGIDPPPRQPDRKAELTCVVAASGDAYREGFAEWLDENWSIWLRFEFEANKLRERGRVLYSARTIGEYIRHSTALREKRSTFKCNDWWWPSLARLYMNEHPTAQGFFFTRERH